MASVREGALNPIIECRGVTKIYRQGLVEFFDSSLELSHAQ